MTDTHKELDAPHADLKAVQTHCANCGTELAGPYCHVCGQSVKNLMKHLPALTADAVDLVFNIDGRIMHTLPALYVRPGFLTLEYFAGRRARYIPPFRLMFFLSVLAFLTIQLLLNLNRDLFADTNVIEMGHGDTPAEVRAQLDEATKQIEAARSQPGLPAISRLALDASERAIQASANQQLQQMGAAPAGSTGAPAVALADTPMVRGYFKSIAEAPDYVELARRMDNIDADLKASQKVESLTPGAKDQLAKLRADLFAAKGKREVQLTRGAPPGSDTTTAGKPMPGNARPGKPPDVRIPVNAGPGNMSITVDDSVDKMPNVHIRWLPQFVSDSINSSIVRARHNLKAMRSGEGDARSEALRRLLATGLSVLPQTMFVLLPLFAVLLKITYIFKRRLYIEHLMVALYSHAFIFASLLLLALLSLVKHGLPAWFGLPLAWLQVAVWIWLPIYLLLMQKRVYRQGWFLTVLKYCFIGICYTVLLSFAVAAAALIGLAA